MPLKATNNNGLKCLNIVFLVSFIIYIFTSVFSILIESSSSDSVVNILARTGNIFSLAASIFISIIAVIVSDSYNKNTDDLLQGILETNQPLKIKQPVKKAQSKSSIALRVSIISSLVTIGILFILDSILQAASLFNVILSFIPNNTEAILSLVLNGMMLLLNVLSILDCVKSSNKYKQTILDIQDVNQQLFDKYNDIVISQTTQP